MKPITALLLLFSFLGTAQTYNFNIEDGDILWQAVYNKPAAIQNYEKQLRLAGVFDNYQFTDDQIICNLRDYKVDFISQGLTYMSTPIFISQMQFNALVVIDFKADRFRVTLKKLEDSPREDGPLGTAGVYSPLRETALKKRNTEIRTAFLNNGAQYLNAGFDSLFNYQNPAGEDDW